MSVSESLLKKVQGLLSKTVDNGCSVAEAATAAALAQKLITEHRLSMADLDDSETEEIEHTTVEGFASARTSTWKNTVASGIAKANDCRLYIHTSHSFGGKRKRIYKIVGRNSDIEIVNYMFTTVSREIERLCKIEMAVQNGHGKTWANSFKNGAASAVVTKLQAARQEAKDAGSSTAIVRLDNRMAPVNDWLEKNIGTLAQRKSPINVNKSAWSSGYAAGKNITTNTGLTGSKTAKSLK